MGAARAGRATRTMSRMLAERVHRTTVMFLSIGLAGGGLTAMGRECPSIVAPEAFRPDDRGPNDVAVVGAQASPADRYGLTVCDISDPENPSPVGEALRPEEAREVAVSGGVAYVADGAFFEIITTECRRPEARFTAEGVGADVEFRDRSLYGPTLWIWDFGDGSISTEKNPFHRYAACGAYTVTLTVANDSGSDSISQQIGSPFDLNGDCETNHADIADLVAEIFDLDGTAPGDAGGGSHPGNERYDVTGNGFIGAEDIAGLVPEVR